MSRIYNPCLCTQNIYVVMSSNNSTNDLKIKMNVFFERHVKCRYITIQVIVQWHTVELPVSLDCPFLIVTSFFSNVYIVASRIKSQHWLGENRVNVSEFYGFWLLLCYLQILLAIWLDIIGVHFDLTLQLTSWSFKKSTLFISIWFSV